jgi:hypothetical protein
MELFSDGILILIKSEIYKNLKKEIYLIIKMLLF